MKQVTYDFSIQQITLALISHCPEIEDGDYKWLLQTESVSSSIPRVFVEQSPGTLPGHIVRITGLKVIRLLGEGIPAQKDDTFFTIKNGEVLFYGDDRTTSGLIEVDQSPGENS